MPPRWATDLLVAWIAHGKATRAVALDVQKKGVRHVGYVDTLCSRRCCDFQSRDVRVLTALLRSKSGPFAQEECRRIPMLLFVSLINIACCSIQQIREDGEQGEMALPRLRLCCRRWQCLGRRDCEIDMAEQGECTRDRYM